MYCNNCGKHNPEDSKFCRYCGAVLIRIYDNKKSQSEDNETLVTKSSKKTGRVNTGLSGWLALVGLGLIAGVFFEGGNALRYLPLLAKNYTIPGYSTVLQLEFFAIVVSFAASVFLLVLYFKKNTNFPKYYVYFLIATIVYVALDYLVVASLTAPTAAMQKALNDSLSKNSGDIARNIITSVIWISYMNKSKQVKATFVNK